MSLTNGLWRNHLIYTNFGSQLLEKCVPVVIMAMQFIEQFVRIHKPVVKTKIRTNYSNDSSMETTTNTFNSIKFQKNLGCNW